MDRLIVLTDRHQTVMSLADTVSELVHCGVATVVLREKDLFRGTRLDLARRIRGLGVRLIVAGPDPLEGDAIHLSSTDADPEVQARLIGRSCHSVSEVDSFTADYVTLSPIYLTDSKPGYGPALGLGDFGRRDNVYALGGIDSPKRAAACIEAGAAGVAVMGALMRDPARARDFVAALS